MTNWTELKRLAEEASWTGRWYDAGCNTVMCTYVDKDVSDHDEIAHPCPLGITGFIAAANPKTILSLIAENEQYKAQFDECARLFVDATEQSCKSHRERDQLRAEVEALRQSVKDMLYAQHVRPSCQDGIVDRCRCWNCSSDRASAL